MNIVNLKESYRKTAQERMGEKIEALDKKVDLLAVGQTGLEQDVKVLRTKVDLLAAGQTGLERDVKVLHVKIEHLADRQDLSDKKMDAMEARLIADRKEMENRLITNIKEMEARLIADRKDSIIGLQWMIGISFIISGFIIALLSALLQGAFDDGGLFQQLLVTLFI